jgi:tRNA(fMet)-specific endonuclease VapC
MAYLFDTDVISATLRRAPDLEVVRRIAATPPHEQFTSAISLGELVFGAVRRNRTDLLERFGEIVKRLPVLPFDQGAAETFGRLKAELEQRGTPVAEPDLRIAAIALAFDLTVVSGNERHFRLVTGLRVENWLAGADG